jgi:hypothetical protein
VRAPVARVALVRKPMVIAAPVRVIVVEEPAARRPLPRAAVVGGSVWVLPKEYAVDELPLGD